MHAVNAIASGGCRSLHDTLTVSGLSPITSAHRQPHVGRGAIVHVYHQYHHPPTLRLASAHCFARLSPALIRSKKLHRWLSTTLTRRLSHHDARLHHAVRSSYAISHAKWDAIKVSPHKLLALAHAQPHAHEALRTAISHLTST